MKPLSGLVSVGELRISRHLSIVTFQGGVVGALAYKSGLSDPYLGELDIMPRNSMIIAPNYLVSNRGSVLAKS